VKGPPPKNPATRQRRNKAATADPALPPESTPAEIEAGIKAPPLPKPPKRKGRRGWSHVSRAYWLEIWRSPMAKKFLRADVPRLVVYLDLFDRYWAGETSVAGELRLQGACFGLTSVDRWRLQWGVADEKPPVTGPTPEPERRPPAPETPPAPPAARSDPRKLLSMVPKTA
jgi:hypothetical protein